MAKLPWAKMSPRIENGVLYWYEGDTFRLNLILNLKDQDGEAVDVPADGSLELVFCDERRDVVKAFTFTGAEAVNGAVGVEVDKAVTALFPAGRYTYDLRLHGEERTTLIRGGEAIVE